MLHYRPILIEGETTVHLLPIKLLHLIKGHICSMKTYRMKNRSTQDEVEVQAETIFAACAKLGWIPAMTDVEMRKDEDQE
ncbi:MAG: hypothetical protein A3F04_01330 [Candidatus Chisholmbacteria bacterium RIFCSPHIGHO2_12_FULL_49_9]|uniref:Uncharacterized protein n=1 Tax=Candidatus Chisholmbacteria bacterium RIFCSPHIGHO2_01_FULL_52_32 TaxID=1797591 RepID=A0A1G1VTI2_9BACT|nr:MAG: hypothetical protein A2786_04475 [Candidatus Chisholmbacteria bacterium RIFCSPHIGHO2_01_FULL_52_32]OGY19909.1 MAG: hypothetical protein A2900_02270 [Candidatus Chisholmbacteria bacterium RIFCSPLOWO2_01_FULL_50_28]OGY21262.1 MAG: hypothetical protein A3F04_01330 [Candidatus Chisholmbacteria bacterium RIFCSPHIGHO2_12_FULL_49_9]